MTSENVFTPLFKNRVRVRIPVSACRWNDKKTQVTIDGGFYPRVSNNDEVTDETPTAFLSGRFYARRVACGLRCRCDMAIYPADAR